MPIFQNSMHGFEASVWKGRPYLTEICLPGNRRGSAFFDCLGMEGDTVPPELNEKEIWQRNNFQSELVVYGYTPLMISAQCVKKNLDRCTRRNSTLWLERPLSEKFLCPMQL